MHASMLSLQAASNSASLVRVVCAPRQEKYEVELNPLHMDWTLVGDIKGSPRAQMRWVVGI